MEQLSPSLAEQIRSARTARGLSEQDLAEQADVCRRTVRNVEQGHPCSLRVLRKLIRVLDIELRVAATHARMPSATQSVIEA